MFFVHTLYIYIYIWIYLQDRELCYDLAINAIVSADLIVPIRESALLLAVDSDNSEFLERLYTRLLANPQLQSLLFKLQPRNADSLRVWAYINGL